MRVSLRLRFVNTRYRAGNFEHRRSMMLRNRGKLTFAGFCSRVPRTSWVEVAQSSNGIDAQVGVRSRMLRFSFLLVGKQVRNKVVRLTWP